MDGKGGAESWRVGGGRKKKKKENRLVQYARYTMQYTLHTQYPRVIAG